jgi:hypothetical protein
MRAHEFIKEEEQLDEILPLIPAIAGGVARAAVGGVGKLAGKAALGVGKLAAKGAYKAAKGVAKGVGNMAKGAYNAVAGDDDEAPTNDPNAKVGTQPATAKPAPTSGKAPTNPGAASAAQGAKTMGGDPALKVGKAIKLPTNTPGGKKNFKVTRTQGDEVEIEDPQAKPGEPKKMTYKSADLQRAAEQ